jgi:ketohexokinase
MARILCVGTVVLDIVCRVEHYPHENKKLRALDRKLRRGGNAANTACVLAGLGHEVEFCGVVGSDAEASLIDQELAAAGVGFTWCDRPPQGRTPTSYITLSQETGARTIVHFRDLPELSCEHFKTLPLHEFDWIHWEGRGLAELGSMLQWTREGYPRIPLSLEAEKPRQGLELLFPWADLLFFSQDFILAKGGTDPASFLLRQHQQFPHAKKFATWGEQGAWGLTPTGELLHQPAWHPATLVETLGAGDTFNAAVIDQCVQGASLKQTLQHACYLAGRKVTQEGYVNLNYEQTLQQPQKSMKTASLAMKSSMLLQ